MSIEESTNDNQLSGDKGDLFTIRDLLKELPYQDRTIRELLANNEIKGYRLREKGKWVVPRSEVINFLRRRGLPISPQLLQKLEPEADAANKTPETHIDNREDPLILKARRRHFIDLREFGRQFIFLLDQYKSWGSGLFLRQGKLSPPEDLAIDYDNLIDSQQFEWLKQHVPNDKVWHTYDQLHFFLYVCQTICFVIDDYDGSDFVSEIRGLIEVAKDDSYFNTEVGSQCISLIDWESTSARHLLWRPLHGMDLLLDEVKEGINLAISRGVFPGTCPACPFNYRTELPD